MLEMTKLREVMGRHRVIKRPQKVRGRALGV